MLKVASTPSLKAWILSNWRRCSSACLTLFRMILQGWSGSGSGVLKNASKKHIASTKRMNWWNTEGEMERIRTKLPGMVQTTRCTPSSRTCGLRRGEPARTLCQCTIGWLLWKGNHRSLCFPRKLSCRNRICNAPVSMPVVSHACSTANNQHIDVACVYTALTSLYTTLHWILFEFLVCLVRFN